MTCGRSDVCVMWCALYERKDTQMLDAPHPGHVTCQ